MENEGLFWYSKNTDISFGGIEVTNNSNRGVGIKKFKAILALVRRIG